MNSKLSFPLKHISVRVPWHDSGWTGAVCKSPSHNTACLKLTNIAERKNDQYEETVAGESLRGMDQSKFPPCVKERGTFMADFALERLHEHPYARSSSETHAHFKPTRLRYPAYAAAALPYLWMMKPIVFGKNKEVDIGLVDQHPLDDVDQSYEPELPFQTRWVQDHRNHRALLECFWRYVKPEESLVFFYAKEVPLIEDIGRRVLIGAGRVKSIGGLTEYDYEGSPEGKTRSLLWERMVIHTIRPDFKDGFLLPYHEALEKSDSGQNFDPAEVVAFAPEDRFTEFSFGTEHVGDDAGIEALLACRAALLHAAELFNYKSHPQEVWIDEQLGRLWKKRGAFPGLGSILWATGVPMANFIAQTLAEEVGEEGNPWDRWNSVIEDPVKHLPVDLAQHVDKTIAKSWQKMSKQRRQFLELLSRVDLTLDQANILAIPEQRKEEWGIDLDDDAFIKNPYLIYEAMRLTQVPVSLGAVDRGMFASNFVREHFPIPEPSSIRTAVDARRLRALVVRELEKASLNGDTLRPQANIITDLRRKESLDHEERTEVTADLLTVVEEEQFPGEVDLLTMADGRKAYQLKRLTEAGEFIRTTINKRIGAKRHQLDVDWRAEFNDYLKQITIAPEDLEKEESARQEKAAALAEIAAARFSVLIGPAGTGKTTVLSVLCRRPEIYKDGILLLAPTGKARVRMEDVARKAGTENFKAATLAQFLSPDRYDAYTQRYLMTGEPGKKVPPTVIVDECSMLTEEMMAALLEAITGVHRLIFVGDHRQLPPIGAGRPFVDIIATLQPDDIEDHFPRITPSYAELTIPRRQGAGERDDLELAAWFGGNVIAPGEDQVFEILAGKRDSETVQFVRWQTPEELERAIPETLAKILKFDPTTDEWKAFACSLGGQVFGDYVYFNRGRSGAKAESWQLLTPVRRQPWGVDNINRHLHVRYKSNQVESANAKVPPWKRRFLKPQGDQQIVYGDKVINNRNQSVYKKRTFPETSEPGYIANGEIGMVVGQIRTKNFNYTPNCLEIEFSTQQNTAFKFYPFSDERDPDLELAYALTIHKAQGSEFEKVFLVLPKSKLMLSRELIYTALTRQKEKVVIFHQGAATDLQQLSSERYSATATRLTNLFRAPNPVAIEGTFLEEGLIHVTTRGDAVRSKSEVIIAKILHDRKINYHYESPLEFDGVVKYPDFTIEDDDSGITYYWEHCGLLHDKAYNRRWQEKQKWYRANKILPHEEGGGPNGTLIVTADRADGGIDAKAIEDMVGKIF